MTRAEWRRLQAQRTAEVAPASQTAVAAQPPAAPQSTVAPTITQTSIAQTGAEQTSTEQTSTAQASAEQTSTEQTSTEQTSTEQTSTEQTTTEQTSTEQTSTEELGVAQTRSRLRRRARVASGSSAGSATLAPLEAVSIVQVTPAADTLPATFAAAPVVEPTACLIDEFELAARALAFTGEVPEQDERVGGATDHISASRSSARATRAAARAEQVVRRGVGRRLIAASATLGVMTVIGLIAVSTTTPASAVSAAARVTADINATTVSTEVPTEDIQAYVTAEGTQQTTLDRPEGYDVASMAEIAADSGVTMFAGTWVNDPEADIQWPFPVGVPISAAYGSSSYLAKFSSVHRGVDLTPGAGAEVHAVAAGTVRIATEAGGEYGVTVVIDHVIDGELVSTRYAHMQYGSLEVSVGDTVDAGEVIGKVGATGKATGPHLHLEVLLGGTAHTDPITWLEEHTEG